MEFLKKNVKDLKSNNCLGRDIGGSVFCACLEYLSVYFEPNSPFSTS
jgi:hypothetical protein